MVLFFAHMQMCFQSHLTRVINHQQLRSPTPGFLDALATVALDQLHTNMTGPAFALLLGALAHRQYDPLGGALLDTWASLLAGKKSAASVLVASMVYVQHIVSLSTSHHYPHIHNTLYHYPCRPQRAPAAVDIRRRIVDRDVDRAVHAAAPSAE